MTDAAPKRIWVWKNSPNGEFVVSDDDQPYPTGSPQYILASEHAALIREAEARGMERAAMTVAQGWCVPPNTRKTFDPDLATGIQNVIRAIAAAIRSEATK